MKIIVVVFLNLLVLLVNAARVISLGDTGSSQSDWAASEGSSKRIRRSIPDWDAVNPSYVDPESQPDHQGAVDPQEEVSPFALADHVSNIFRRHKNVKEARKSHARVSPGERASNVARQDESVEVGVLPPDEQEECYRQQNIDPPPPATQRWRHSGKSTKLSMDVALAPNILHKRSKCNLQRPFGKTGELHKSDSPEEVFSLYSGPENVSVINKNSGNGNRKQYQLQKDRLYDTDPSLDKNDQYEKKYPPLRLQSPKKNRPPFLQGKRSEGKMNRRMYKSTELEAEFPVYDEDIEFSPDPLQGLLDDKYWENQEDKGALIKKYIDLAANNMVPYGVDIVKRDTDKSPDDAGYNECGDRCPCNQVVACKDCKKGKQEENQEVKFTTKSIKYDPNGKRISPISPNSNEDKGSSVVSCHKQDAFSRKLLSLDYDYENNCEEEETNSGGPDYNTNYIGRKLLSLEDESEDDSDDEEIEDERINRKRSHEEREDSYNDYQDYTQEYINENSPVDKFPTLNVLRFQNELPIVTSRNVLGSAELSKYAKNESSTSLKMPFLEIATRNPGLYVPNKIANMIQKVRQEKPKGTKKPTTPEVNPDQEFEAIENETFLNAVGSNMYGRQNKTKRKLGVEESIPFEKRRRSPKALRPGLIQPLVSTLDQTSDDNKLSNSFNNTFDNQTDTTPNNTAVSVNTTSTENRTIPTSTTAFVYPTRKMHSNNKLKADAGENVDAEIANDIVETVLMESQRNSLLGHNLGLCRRNESLMNLNYGRIVPETEKIVSSILDCVMGKVKDHLAAQSCILLDAELLDFLKWIVLTGESYREFSRKGDGFVVTPKKAPSVVATTCGPVKDDGALETTTYCEPDVPDNMDFGFGGQTSNTL